ncbi:MAG: hypothetical protein V4671_24875, partial [Armatimonadota bacterium]
MSAQESISDEDRLYQEYLKVVEGYAWFRTYYPGDAYANETFENREEAKKHWDSTLIVEPIDEPKAAGKRDGFLYVRVTQRHRGDLLADDPAIKQRVLAAMEAKGCGDDFANALRMIIRAERGAGETRNQS